MKIETKSAVVHSTMGGEAIAMKISEEEGDFAHIMSIMTDLYQDRLAAVIREYSTNAWDAHVEAGFSGPIEVTLPNHYEPSLTIKDYGDGLDIDDIRTIYSQYGRSTKRGTNAQTGMLGLGCKSALTYTTSFNVESIKDGRLVSVLVARNEEGGGSMTVVGPPEGLPTDEANGTKVTVAIRGEDTERANALATEFFSYWPEGAALVNGEAPERFEGLKITDTIYLRETDEAQDNIVVMGNVSYPVNGPGGTAPTLDTGLRHSYGQKYASIVAFVPVGSVKPVPAREGLMDVRITNETLKKVEEAFKQGLAASLQREIDQVDDEQTALMSFSKWRKWMPNGAKLSDYTYKGRAFPDAWTPDERVEMTNSKGYGSRSATMWTGQYAPEHWPFLMWVKGYDVTKFTARHKDKLLQYCDEQQIPYERSHYYADEVEEATVQTFVLLTAGVEPPSEFVDPARIVDWSTIREVKLPNQSPVRASWQGPARLKGSYDWFTEEDTFVGKPGSDIRDDVPIYVISGQRSRERAHKYRQCLNTLSKKYTLVCLPSNRLDKFYRDRPKAQAIEKVIEGFYKTFVDGVSEDDLKAIAYNSNYNRQPLDGMDASKIDDPALRDAIKLGERDVSKIGNTERAFGNLIYKDDLKKRWRDLPVDADPLKNYPLLLDSYGRIKTKPNGDIHPHVYLYVNTVYAAFLDTDDEV